MMTIAFFKPESYLYSVSKLFGLIYEHEWMEDPEVRQMIRDIDNTELINPTSAFSPILGSISVDRLSGGVKGLIMIKHDEERRTYSSCMFGDNCAEWLCKLSFEVDFTLYSQHALSFSHGLEPGKSRPINCCGRDGRVFTDSREAFKHTAVYGRWGEDDD